MSVDPLWRMAARNLRRNPRRCWATGSSVAVGMASVLAVFGFIDHIEHWFRVNQIYLRRSGHVAIYKRGGLENHRIRPEAYGFSPDEQRSIAAALADDPTIERIGRHLLGTGLIGNGCRTIPFRAVGIDPSLEFWLRQRPEVQTVTPSLAGFERGRGTWEYPNVDGAIGTTALVARKLGKTRTHDESPSAILNPAGAVIDCAASGLPGVLAADANVQLLAATYSGSFGAMDGEIVNWFTTGLTEAESDEVSTSLAVLQRLFETDLVTYVSVFLRPAAADQDLAQTARRIGATLTARGLVVDVYPWSHPDLAPTYVGGMRFLRVLGLVSLAIMALLVGLTLVNTVALSVAERAREIGTLRAMGFNRRHVLGMQLRELTLLVLLAEAAGLALTALFATAARASSVSFGLPGLYGTKLLRIEPHAAAVAGSVLVLFVVAIGVCLFTAARQLRQRPIDLLVSS